MMKYDKADALFRVYVWVMLIIALAAHAVIIYRAYDEQQPRQHETLNEYLEAEDIKVQMDACLDGFEDCIRR